MDATKKPTETCLFWALKHLVRPGDSVTVLGILHQITTPMGYKSQPNLSDFVGTNKATLEAEMSQKLGQFEDKLRILADLCDNRGVYLDITITAGSPLKSVMVKEAAKMKATHVLLDRHLKKDKKYYKEQLQCEVLAFSEKSQPERVREGNISHMFDNPGLPLTRINSASSSNPSSRSSTATCISLDGNSVPNSDVASSKEQSSALPLSATVERETTPLSCHSDAFHNHNSICAADGRSRSQHSGDFPAEPGTQSAAFSSLQLEDTSFIDLLMLNSPNGVTPIWSSAKDNKVNPSKKEISTDQANVNQEFRSPTTEKAGTREGIISGRANSIVSSNISAHLGASNVGKSPLSTSYADNHMSECSEKEVISVQPRKRFSQLNDLMRAHDFQSGINSSKKVTESKPAHPHGQADPKVDTESVVSAGEATESEQQFEKPTVFTEDVIVKHLSQAPPLCSICKFTSMELGRAPRVYEWRELKAVTNNFASENLIAEGGFSFVYRGIFPEGQTVAIKKLKTMTLQNDVQFTTEVEALSYAQHRNLVRLLGYGVGGNNDRALVYEYVCNGSLDQHLSVQNGDVLQWSARYKIAIGAARGLRYLHEECRVGCIVHRDMRPNNILLTHDFEPMVGDFGLAKMNRNVDAAIETQVVGALGFLAPEYVEFGQVTSKTDVYAFGVVLLELISGRKAIDLQRPKGEISLVEWARQKLRHHRVRELVDTRVAESLDMLELDMMIKAASLCIMRDPHSRPGISQVLRILEGERHELSNEFVQDHPNFDRALQASSKSQTPEDLYQSSNRLQMVQSTKRLSAVPTSWRSWVRTS